MAEEDLVDLVGPDGSSSGTTTVALAHVAPGLLHRAFSVVVHDGAGSVLLQRRAAAKLRFAGAWANAACGHVAPGHDVREAAAARFAAELGVDAPDLVEAGVHVYRAADPGSPMVECEHDHVLVGRMDRDVALAPDPAEIAETAWVPVAAALEGRLPEPAAPWLDGVLVVAEPYLR